MKTKALLLATSFALLLPSIANAKPKTVKYRPNTKVVFIYNQELDEPYSTRWFAKLEKRQGKKRTVYIETWEKYVNKGFITFDCGNPKASVQLDLYGWGEFGDDSQLEKTTVHSKDFKAWQMGDFEPLAGESPPYELYQKLRTKYCKS